MCETIAPIIVKKPNNAPQKVVFGFRINIAVISSKLQKNPPEWFGVKFRKIATESGCAENLKNKVVVK